MRDAEANGLGFGERFCRKCGASQVCVGGRGRHSPREKTVAKSKDGRGAHRQERLGLETWAKGGSAWGKHSERKATACFGVCPPSHQAGCCTGTGMERGAQEGVMAGGPLRGRRVSADLQEQSGKSQDAESPGTIVGP